MEQRFRIVFEKLNAALQDSDGAARLVAIEISVSELDEVRELGRLAALVSEVEPTSYTST